MESSKPEPTSEHPSWDFFAGNYRESDSVSSNSNEFEVSIEQGSKHISPHGMNAPQKVKNSSKRISKDMIRSKPSLTSIQPIPKTRKQRKQKK
jgi:hypothetical protein